MFEHILMYQLLPGPSNYFNLRLFQKTGIEIDCVGHKASEQKGQDMKCLIVDH